jgi:hypothetical protein
MFRDDLYMLFSMPYIQKIEKSIKIKSSQNDLTDIDAIVYDKKNNTLLLFQLKWQDPHGNSMRERRSRMKNLVSEANQWVGIINDWIRNISKETMISILGLKPESKIDKIKLIVLARHQIRFTNSEPLSSDAIWGTWPQFCRLMSTESNHNDFLNSFLDKLQEEQCRSESPRMHKGSDIFKIGTKTFEISIV